MSSVQFNNMQPSSNFYVLPLECIEKVFSFLDLDSFKNASLVSKKINQIFNQCNKMHFHLFLSKYKKFFSDFEISVYSKELFVSLYEKVRDLNKIYSHEHANSHSLILKFCNNLKENEFNIIRVVSNGRHLKFIFLFNLKFVDAEDRIISVNTYTEMMHKKIELEESGYIEVKFSI